MMRCVFTLSARRLWVVSQCRNKNPQQHRYYCYCTMYISYVLGSSTSALLQKLITNTPPIRSTVLSILLTRCSSVYSYKIDRFIMSVSSPRRAGLAAILGWSVLCWKCWLWTQSCFSSFSIYLSYWSFRAHMIPSGLCKDGLIGNLAVTLDNIIQEQ